MKFDRRQFVIATSCVFGSAAAGSAQDVSPPAETPNIKVRGRIVCLTEELQQLYQLLPECDARGHIYTLKTSTGQCYPLLPTDSAAAVWLDSRYRERELQITARRFPQTAYLEVIKFQSWRENKLYDLDYYCIVCNIATHKPGPCECCQDPMEFREVLTSDFAGK